MTLSQDTPAAAEEEHYLQLLGQRIRCARERRGLTGASLAARSGLSHRFLTEVERGRGNISILRLIRLAAALGMRVEDFLPDGRSPRAEPEEPRWPLTPNLVVDLFHRAGAREQEAALALLVRGLGGNRAA